VSRLTHTSTERDLDTLLDPESFVGRAPEQVEKFTEERVIAGAG
jgi:adenylosuccinate lyase